MKLFHSTGKKTFQPQRKLLRFLLEDLLPTTLLLALFAAGMIWVNIHFGL